MHDPLTKLLGQIVSDTFGETAETVIIDIASFQIKTLGQIVSSTNLSIKEVRAVLGVLVKHGLVSYTDNRKPGCIDYKIETSNILSFLRFPRFLQIVKTNYGDEEEVLIEELMKAGSETVTNIIFRAAKRIYESLVDNKQPPNISDLHKKLSNLITSDLIRRSTATENSSEKSEIDPLQNIPVDVDLQAISAAVANKLETVQSEKDQAVLWRLNMHQFELMWRDQMIVSAAERRLDKQAGLVVQSLLKIVAELATHPWEVTVSTHFGYHTISEQVAGDHGKDSHAHIYLDQYLRVLSDDRTRFIDRVGDSGGGQYHVDLKHIVTEIVDNTLECIILEKFSSKAVRVFRYIREKKYVEEGQLQQVVMIPAKETKLLTYQLLENHFIHLQELRKSVAPTAPSKAIYLFYVDLPQVVRTCVSVVYKSLYNSRSRAKHESVENARLLDKHERIESIAASLRSSGGTEEQLEEVMEMMTPPEREAVRKIQLKLDKLNKAQIQVDETLFTMSLYLHYKSKS